jgi:predicted oxidoreductase
MTFGSIPGYSQNCKPMCDAIVELAKSKGADFQLNTKATALVVDDNDHVIGIQADNNRTTKYFKASKAVALTCGDFAYNRDMLLQYTPKLGLGAPNSVEVIANDGACTRMALALGATMTGSNSYSKRDGTIDEGNREVGYRSMYRADEILVRQPWLRFNMGVERMLFKFSGDSSEAETAEVAMTKTGLKVDTDMRVLNGTGDPIPGLYAGFHTAGGSCGDCCEGDFIFSNVSTSLIGGRMVSDGVLKNEA